MLLDPYNAMYFGDYKKWDINVKGVLFDNSVIINLRKSLCLINRALLNDAKHSLITF